MLNIHVEPNMGHSLAAVVVFNEMKTSHHGIDGTVTFLILHKWPKKHSFDFSTFCQKRTQDHTQQTTK